MTDVPVSDSKSNRYWSNRKISYNYNTEYTTKWKHYLAWYYLAINRTIKPVFYCISLKLCQIRIDCLMDKALDLRIRGREFESRYGQVGWLVVLRINVDLAIFQPYLDLEAGDNQSLKIQVARPGIEPRSSCSASQELNHSATAAPCYGQEFYIL